MTDQNQKQNGRQGSEINLDRLLDVALAKYAAAEPRPGLEDRILANIRAEHTKHAWWRSNVWHWGLATTIAAIFIAAVGVTLILEKSPQPVVKNPVFAPMPQIKKKPETQVAKHNPDSVQRPHRYHATHYAMTGTVAEAYPKLDQFPSPQPLSEQEKLLLEYVRQHPDEALLTAKAQEEFDAKIHADLLQATTQTGLSGSGQISDQ